MVAISFRFLAGRFHATPWGRHVNEGAVEWPPSPWRILRAMVATWKRTLPALEEGRVRPTLEQISEPPEFLLPHASTGHTRHFMPWYKKGPEDRTLVFDTFVVVPKSAPVIARWPEVSLDDEQHEVLNRILTNLGTLGRSESWCNAALGEEVGLTDVLPCRPITNGERLDGDIIRLLCADPATAFADDGVVTICERKEGRGKNRRVVEKRTTVYDPAWNLCMETLQLHAERWSMPPGARWVDYARPRECFARSHARRPVKRRAERPRVQVVRYALDSSVLPLSTETLPVADAVRRTLMGIYGRFTESNGVRGRSAVFSGKDEDGAQRKGHKHAYYLPTDEDGDGRLDHLTVFAREGFGDAERHTLDCLHKLVTGREVEERHELRLLLIGMGCLQDCRSGPVAHEPLWESVTPYVATRFAKTRGRDRVDLRSAAERCTFLVADLQAQLRDVLGVAPGGVVVEPLTDNNGAFRIAGRRPIQFKRFRRKATDDGGRRLAGAFRVTFPATTPGPIALGYSSHFGLGLFLPPGGSPS